MLYRSWIKMNALCVYMCVCLPAMERFRLESDVSRQFALIENLASRYWRIASIRARIRPASELDLRHYRDKRFD